MQVALQAHPTWVVCKADFRNAFNECSRLAFLTFVAAHFPLLALALLAAYGAPAYVTALGPQGWVRFLSRRGCMQGCPAGPLCFAAALQRVLVQARLDHPQCLIIALHDDLQVAGPPDLARLALRDVIERASDECGLTPTGHKFVVYSSRVRDVMAPEEVAALDALEADIEQWTPAEDLALGRRCSVQSDGVEVAGVPIGTAAYVHSVARARVASHEAAVHERVRLLQCVQSAFVILRVSLAARMVYLARACGPVIARPGPQGEQAPLEAHDEQVRRTLSALLQRPWDTAARRQARETHFEASVFVQAALPCKLGGLGLVCMMWVADCCFVAGVMACLEYAGAHSHALHLPDIRPQTALPFVRELCAAAHRVVSQTDTPVDLLSLLPGSPRCPHQRDLSGGVMERRRRVLAVELPDPQRRAVLVSASGQFAGHWVQAIPVADCWRARPRLFQLALCVRLGVPIPELDVSGGVACGACGMTHDKYGRHPSLCMRGNRSYLWTERHDGQRAVQRVRCGSCE